MPDKNSDIRSLGICHQHRHLLLDPAVTLTCEQLILLQVGALEALLACGHNWEGRQLPMPVQDVPEGGGRGEGGNRGSNLTEAR
jgi:hypothetical protein